MQIEIKIDEACKEPRVIVVTDRMTDEIRALAGRLSGESPHVLAGFREDAVTLLAEEELIRIYTAAGAVMAETAAGEYRLRLRLYELEARLNPGRFVRISNSEIVNLDKVKGFDLSLAGTIRVTLAGGAVTYVSRRYVTKIKQALGI